MAKFGFHGTVLHPVEQDWVSKQEVEPEEITEQMRNREQNGLR